MAQGNAKPMSVFKHFVANAAIAHMAVVRAARDAGLENNTPAAKEVSRLTVILFNKLHRLETLYRELGGAAVFGTPPSELSQAELVALFPPEK